MGKVASIIVPCWLPSHAPATLIELVRSCILSARMYCYDSELIVVDNASELEVEVEFLKRHADIYIHNDENVGYGPAINQGIKAATTDWFIAMNDDAELVDDWAAQAIDAWDRKTGILSSYTVGDDEHVNYPRNIVKPHRWFGGLWMTSRAIIDEVGLLDEGYRQGFFEDLDLVMRIYTRGYEIVKSGHCKHLGSASWISWRGGEVWRPNHDKFVARWADKWTGPLWQVKERAEKPFLSIVTRCYKRPEQLKRLEKSLAAQTDQDLEHVKIVDDVGVGFYQADKLFAQHADCVTGQYVLIVDDDDLLVRDTLVEELKGIVAQEEPDVIMLKMDGPYGILPRGWGQVPTKCDVGMPNYVVRADLWREHVHEFSTGDAYGDFYFIKALFDLGVKVHWHDVVAVKVPKRGWGKEADQVEATPDLETEVIEETPVQVEEVPAQAKRALIIKAVVTTLDNLDNLKETIMVLRDEPLSEIIIVNNGSRDGTAEWLHSLGTSTAHYGVGAFDGTRQADDSPMVPVRSGCNITCVHRENLGAGPGRNAGLDVAGEFDYVLMLDGGIRPLRGGTRRMLDYLERTSQADVIGVEIVDFETDPEKAWRRWPHPIKKAYHNTRLSHTAYCLCRARAWDNIRFCEEGPFGEPGWGADDDEMAYRWNEAGIVVHVVTCDCKHDERNACTGVHPYRRASGSFRRLYKDTGIWPNQYGSVYEQRLVWLQQNWPQHEPGLQWGEPWLTVVVQVSDVEQTAKLVKAAHDELRKRHFKPPWNHIPNPYSVVAWGDSDDWLVWAEPRRLRQHHGDAILVDGTVVRRNNGNESTWAGDFRLWNGDDWQGAVRPGAHYYGLVRDESDLDALLAAYDEAHPRQPVKKPPKVGRTAL